MRLLSENLHLALRRATRFALQENYCDATFCGDIHYLIRRLNSIPRNSAAPSAFVHEGKHGTPCNELSWFARDEIIRKICVITSVKIFFRNVRNNEFSLKTEFRRKSSMQIQIQNAMNTWCIAHLCTKNLENVKKPEEEIRALIKARARNENETIMKSNKTFMVRMFRPGSRGNVVHNAPRQTERKI